MTIEQRFTGGKDRSMNETITTMQQLPKLAELDLISQEYIRDPAGMLRQARASDPVFYLEKMGCWVYSRYADVREALMDFETYSNATLAAAPVPLEYQERVPTNFFAKSFNAMDPPAHNPVRKIGHSGFSNDRLAPFEEPITVAANDIIDGFIAAGHCELMHDFCHELSHRVITAFLGLPSSDIPRLKQLAEDLPRVFTDHMTPMPEAEKLQRWQRVADLRDYFRSIIQQRRSVPTTDFVSMLIRAKDEQGEPLLDDARITTHMTELVFAGTDTTANLIANAVILLDRSPAELARMKREPELTSVAIEEVLRLKGSVNGLFRKTTRQVDIAGHSIPAGALVYLSTGSADQDAAQFQNPEVFDITRKEASQHLAFGKGRHLCIGAPLARLEARIALETLYRRLPGLKVRLGQDLEYDPILLSVMLKSLTVEW
ncbi:MAG: cytochrome P450 [Betaproteobacteria bacterium]|nr:cytochrome P450 [Betaproteobacteria bacterium]